MLPPPAGNFDVASSPCCPWVSFHKLIFTLSLVLPFEREAEEAISNITLPALYSPVQVIKRGTLHCFSRCNAQNEEKQVRRLPKALRNLQWLIWARDPPPWRNLSNSRVQLPTLYEPRVEWSFLAIPMQWGRSIIFTGKPPSVTFPFLLFASPHSWWGRK